MSIHRIVVGAALLVGACAGCGGAAGGGGTRTDGGAGPIGDAAQDAGLAPADLSMEALPSDMAMTALLDMSLTSITAPVDLSLFARNDLTPSRDPLIVARPYAAHIPNGYDASKPTPLVVMLHGYASSGASHESTFFKLTALSDAKTFLYAYPDGTQDAIGLRFWNATDGCCNIFNAAVDDVAYLKALLDDMSARYNVDPKRIYFVGHSNGGFMSHRMACDVASRVAAIVSFAGDDWKDATKCVPSEPVAILQIHGDNDPTIQYGGGQNFPLAPYPSAHDSVAGWAQKLGCGATPDGTAAPVNVIDDGTVAGAETTRSIYMGCQSGDAELWTMHGGVHEPPLDKGVPELLWTFLSAHPKN